MFVLLAILALGVLVVVHEAGHYFVARWSKMRVERFSIGFGPALVKWRSGDTQFQIAPVPFGGFVQITGMNPHEEFDDKDPTVYPNRPAILRFLVILAGPAMNYVLAVVVAFAFFLVQGIDRPKGRDRVGEVVAGLPAEGKLKTGDLLISINGVEVFHPGGGRPDFRAEVQKSQGQPVTVQFERDGKRLEAVITPKFDAPTKEGEKPSYRVGVGLEAERMSVGPGQAAYLALLYPVDKTKQMLNDLYRVATRQADGQVLGPLGVMDVMQERFAMGWAHALELIATLNVMLGLFNLLPFPGLDGGRLAFLGYELATRRRPNPKVEATVHMFGILLLFVVLIVVTFNDTKNLLARLLS